MTLKASIVQARTFSKVTDSEPKRKAFLNYARAMCRITQSQGVRPKKVVWCPCKAPGYFMELSSKTPPGIAKNTIKKLLNVIK